MSPSVMEQVMLLVMLVMVLVMLLVMLVNSGDSLRERENIK